MKVGLSSEVSRFFSECGKKSGRERISKKVKEHFSKLGKKGGVSRSEAKVLAVRENGKLGGRPKKKKVE